MNKTYFLQSFFYFALMLGAATGFGESKNRVFTKNGLNSPASFWMGGNYVADLHSSLLEAELRVQIGHWNFVSLQAGLLRGGFYDTHTGRRDFDMNYFGPSLGLVVNTEGSFRFGYQFNYGEGKIKSKKNPDEEESPKLLQDLSGEFVKLKTDEHRLFVSYELIENLHVGLGYGIASFQPKLQDSSPRYRATTASFGLRAAIL